MQNPYRQKLRLFLKWSVPLKFHSYFSQSRKPNMKILILIFCFLSFPQAYLKHCMVYTNDLNTKQLLHYQRCSFSSLELNVFQDRWVIAPETHHNLFQIHHLCVLTYITQKLNVVYGRCTYWMTVPLSDRAIFWVKAACKIHLVRYSSRHALKVFFDMAFVCKVTCMPWKLQVI